MHIIGFAFALSFGGAVLAFMRPHAGSAWLWLALGVVQLPLAVLAIARGHRSGAIRDVLQPRWGDVSMAAGSALALYAVTWIGRLWITPTGSSREAWLMHVYLQIGDPQVFQRNPTVLGVALLVGAACDELAWRGLVLPEIEERFGSRKGWIAVGLVYGLSYLPSAWLLRAEVGANPLVVATALLGGLVWSLLAARTQRLVPSILSHGLYIWFVVAQLRLIAV